MSVILETQGLTRRFGAVVAAEGIDVRITQGTLVGMIGANGAGKTTFLNIVTGYVKPSQGIVRFRDRDITGLPPRVIVALGLCRSFQIAQLFDSLTVVENVLLAQRLAAGRAQSWWRPLKDAAGGDEAAETLRRFNLERLAGQPVAALPQGARKLLDIALATVRKPQMLLLDEPTSGVSAEEKFGLFDILVRALRESGTTTIFVEHDMDLVSRYADQVLALADGKVIARGGPKEVLGDPEVRRLVIGVED